MMLIRVKSKAGCAIGAIIFPRTTIAIQRQERAAKTLLKAKILQVRFLVKAGRLGVKIFGEETVRSSVIIIGDSSRDPGIFSEGF